MNFSSRRLATANLCHKVCVCEGGVCVTYMRSQCHLKYLLFFQTINLADVSRERSRLSLVFSNKAGDRRSESLDDDGLPHVGEYLQTGDAYYRYGREHYMPSMTFQTSFA